MKSVRRAFRRGKSGRTMRSRKETSASARTPSCVLADEGRRTFPPMPLPFCADVGDEGRCAFGRRYSEERIGSVCSGRRACGRCEG